MLGLFKGVAKAPKKIVSRFAKVGSKKGNMIILDFRDRVIKLPNGDVIRPDDILHFDTQTMTLTYRAPSGELRVLTLEQGETIADKALQAFLESHAKKRGEPIHV